MTKAPDRLTKDDSGGWALWEKLAKGRPEFGNPAVFNSSIPESYWLPYAPPSKDQKNFQMTRTIDPDDGGVPIEVVVDFLRPYDAVIEKNRPALTTDFATQRAFGADLATRFYEMVAVEGTMPGGGTNRVMIAVASIPALLAMKGHALDGRNKPKDAYDVYFSIRNFPGGIDALVEACKPLLKEKSAAEGYAKVAGKFRAYEDFGPTCVRRFVEGEDILGSRTPDEWQQDAFGQVQAWLNALGIAA